MTNQPKNIPLPDGEAAIASLIGLAQGTFNEETPAVHDAGLVRFERAVARRTLRRRGTGVIWAVGLGAAAVVALVAFVSLPGFRGHRSLTFDVVNATVGSGGYVRANVTGNADVRFSDGSSLTLDPGTGARVGDFDSHGGRVLLESGRARVQVKPLPHANWTVDAGPYSVHVIGTEFDIRWSANEEVLDVHLLKGAIVVRGPLARDGLSMEAGAHLFANVRKGEIHLDGQPAGASSAEEGPAATAATAVAAPTTPMPTPTPTAHGVVTAREVVAGPAAPAVTPPAVTPPAAHASHPTAQTARSRTLAMANPHANAPAPETGWNARLGRGDFQGIIGDAERRGLDTVFTTASPSDLNVLADAARFARRGEVARGALLAERTRFPGSSQGRDAAFFLGGLAEDEPGSSAMKTALDWYERYLRESPNGTFVRPVLGRRMVLVQKLRGNAAARPLAAEYLERFADGPYAGTARKVLETR